MKATYFNRDLSWLTFNQRILDEAGRDTVPLIERLRFLGIFSSNLDEFYRVRIPVLKALQKIHKKGKAGSKPVHQDTFQQVKDRVLSQQDEFGRTLAGVVQSLSEEHIELLHDKPIPEVLDAEVRQYFVSHVLALLTITKLKDIADIFPVNNELHLLVETGIGNNAKLRIVNIPTQLPRFYKTVLGNMDVLIYLEDIVRTGLWRIFPGETITASYTFKVTRDAELELQDEYPGDLAEQIEQKLKKRDKGLATRLLLQSGMPSAIKDALADKLNLKPDVIIEGGRYHNLKDFLSIQLQAQDLSYKPQPPLLIIPPPDQTLAAVVAKEDILLHTPYHCYDTVVQFFNEAAQDPDVKEIAISLYRVASDSRIVSALIKAAENGKKVRVMLELKARFDEENNVKWSKQLKAAGATIGYSRVSLKVHAKIALVKSLINGDQVYRGILSTGNFHERTAKIYTDHILLTADQPMLAETAMLFDHLFSEKNKRKPAFEQLLVSRFNLLDRFLEMIDMEIQRAVKGEEGSITIKLNNLEEERLINKLYEASAAGVRVQLIVRSICRIIPGISGLSENISVRRIVGRYLEHGRIFVFGNGGDPRVFLGSADWMNRNIYRRIEVCFPVKNAAHKQQILHLLSLQLKDNVQAVMLNENMANIPVPSTGVAVSSQEAIYHYLKDSIA